jgi:hypothetical protein
MERHSPPQAQRLNLNQQAMEQPPRMKKRPQSRHTENTTCLPLNFHQYSLRTEKREENLVERDGERIKDT